MNTKQILRKLLESDGVLVFKNLRTGAVKRFTKEEWDRAEYETLSPSEKRAARRFGHVIEYPKVGEIVDFDGETWKCIQSI